MCACPARQRPNGIFSLMHTSLSYTISKKTRDKRHQEKKKKKKGVWREKCICPIEFLSCCCCCDYWRRKENGHCIQHCNALLMDACDVDDSRRVEWSGWMDGVALHAILPSRISSSPPPACCYVILAARLSRRCCWWLNSHSNSSKIIHRERKRLLRGERDNPSHHYAHTYATQRNNNNNNYNYYYNLVRPTPRTLPIKFRWLDIKNRKKERKNKGLLCVREATDFQLFLLLSLCAGWVVASEREKEGGSSNSEFLFSFHFNTLFSCVLFTF